MVCCNFFKQKQIASFTDLWEKVQFATSLWKLDYSTFLTWYEVELIAQFWPVGMHEWNLIKLLNGHHIKIILNIIQMKVDWVCLQYDMIKALKKTLQEKFAFLKKIAASSLK